jgi:hypothetical protein
MIDTSGIRGFGTNPVPNEDLLKQIRLNTIKTRAGKVAYLMLVGHNADLGGMANGIKKAEGALKWVARVMEERARD